MNRGAVGGRGPRGRGRLPAVEAVGSNVCGTCSLECGDDAVGCDRCSSWYHPSSMCLGLPKTVVGAIQECGGDGIAFICTSCRCSVSSKNADNANGSALQQLFQTVKMLCEAVQTLTKQMTSLDSKEGASPTLDPTRGDLKLMIREEVREMEERAKRKDSVIVRGLIVSNGAQFSDAFNPIAQKLVGKIVPITNVVCIDRNKRLYRIKVVDDLLRTKLLESAKLLKSSEFKNVYINKDLTFAQRKVLRERRAANSSSGLDKRVAGSPDVTADVVESGKDLSNNFLR